MEWLLSAANLVYLASYFVRDVLALRLLTVIGAAALIPYFWLQPDPLMGPVCWNLLFIALNVYRIVRRTPRGRTCRPVRPVLLTSRGGLLSTSGGG